MSEDTLKLRRLEMILALASIGGVSYLDRLHADMRDELKDLEDFVNDQNRDADLTLDLKVKMTLTREGLLKLSAKHNFKSPQLPAAGGIAWISNGEVTPQNPAQMRFNLQPAPAPIRSYADDGGAEVIETRSAPIYAADANRRIVD